MIEPVRREERDRALLGRGDEDAQRHERAREQRRVARRQKPRRRRRNRGVVQDAPRARLAVARELLEDGRELAEDLDAERALRAVAAVVARALVLLPSRRRRRVVVRVPVPDRVRAVLPPQRGDRAVHGDELAHEPSIAKEQTRALQDAQDALRARGAVLPGRGDVRRRHEALGDERAEELAHRAHGGLGPGRGIVPGRERDREAFEPAGFVETVRGGLRVGGGAEETRQRLHGVGDAQGGRRGGHRPRLDVRRASPRRGT
eukprot:11601-Pelagococcus_subviridis.AAC.3